MCVFLREWLVMVTRQHHFHQVSFLDLRGRSQQLQDVLGRLVVTEQQDLVVHPVEHTLRDLTDTQRTHVSAGRRPAGGDAQKAGSLRAAGSVSSLSSLSSVSFCEERTDTQMLNIKASHR